MNYGYTSTSIIVKLDSGLTEKVFFHPTKTKGYKDQYSGPHNFGTSWIRLNQDNPNEILVCTDQSKALTYNIETKEMLELKAYSHFGFDRFKDSHKNKHMHRGFIKKDLIQTNFGSKFLLWNKQGETLLEEDNIENINIDSSCQTYCIGDLNLCKTTVQ